MEKKRTNSINDAIEYTKNMKENPSYSFEEPCIRYEPKLPPDNLDTIADEIEKCLMQANVEVQRETPNLPNSRIFRKWGITIRNQPFQLDAIEFAIEHPDTVPISVNINDWLNNMRRFNIFMVLWRLCANLLETLRRAFRFPAVFSFEAFSNYYRNVKMLAEEGNNEAQVIYERLKPLFNRNGRFIHSARDDNHKIDIEIDYQELRGIVKENNSRISNLLRKKMNL